MTMNVNTDKIFDYLKSISPDGFGAAFCFIDWELIKKFTLHWLKTGENQFQIYMDLCSFLYQIDFTKKNIRRVDDFILRLEPLLKGKYIFDIKDILPSEHCEIIRTLYKNITEPKTIKKKRRIIACRVTQMKTVRETVFMRDNYKCKYCGSNEKLTVDHIIPVDQGGKDEFSNFQTLCLRCNSSKSNKIIED